jgi:hypothetical protein
MAATKKSTRKRPAKRSSARKRSAPKSAPKVSYETESVPFPPETKVGIHEAALVDVERAGDREPFEKPITTATVTKEGRLKVTGLKKGQYNAVGEVEPDTYRYFAFSVK